VKKTIPLVGVLIMTLAGYAGTTASPDRPAVTPTSASRPQPVDESRILAAHKTNTTIAAMEARAKMLARRAKKRAAHRAAARLAHACRPIPGYNAIVTGSTVTECRQNRALTLQKIREEQAHPPTGHDTGDQTDPCPNGAATGPQCSTPQTRKWARDQAEWARKHPNG